MKVDPNVPSLVNAQPDPVQSPKTTRAQETAPEGQTAQVNGSGAGSDTVQFSSTLAEVQQLTAKVQQLPDVRSERVAMLKQQIQQGTYNPDPADVADALLNNAVHQGGKS